MYKYFDVECPFLSRCGSLRRSLQRPQSPRGVESIIYQRQQQQEPKVESGGTERRVDRSTIPAYPFLRSFDHGNDDNDDGNVAATGVNHDVTEF